MNIRELVEKIRAGEINPYHDLTAQYQISKDTVKRRLKSLGLEWKFREEVLIGELSEESGEMLADEVFKATPIIVKAKQKPNASIDESTVKASTSEPKASNSKSEHKESKSQPKASEKKLDTIDMLLSRKADSKKRTYRGFYFDDDVLSVIDGISAGNKSDLVNEVLRKVFRDKGLLE